MVVGVSGPECLPGQTFLCKHQGALILHTRPEGGLDLICIFFEDKTLLIIIVLCLQPVSVDVIWTCDLTLSYLNSFFVSLPSENKPKNGGICVANHTSPIDVIILASDGCYAMVFTWIVLICWWHFFLVSICTCWCANCWRVCVFIRLVKSTEAWWGSFRDPWWKPAHTFGLNALKSKTDTWWPKGRITSSLLSSLCNCRFSVPVCSFNNIDCCNFKISICEQ